MTTPVSPLCVNELLDNLSFVEKYYWKWTVHRLEFKSNVLCKSIDSNSIQYDI